MNKLLRFGFVLSVAIASNAYAGTDMRCLQDCTSQGYLRQLCMQKCSFGGGVYGGNRVDPSIPLSVQQPHLMTPYEAQEKALQLQQLQLQNQLLQQQIQNNR